MEHKKGDIETVLATLFATIAIVVGLLLTIIFALEDN